MVDISLFKNNKYTRIYFQIVFNIKSQNRIKNNGLEHHHIFPQCIFPEIKSLKRNSWNGVYVNHREHFVLHWLLTKMFIKTVHTKKMGNAFSFMCERYSSGWRYEKARLGASMANKGRKVSVQSRKNMSDAQRKSYAEGRVVNFKGRTHTEETKKIFSEQKSGENHPFYGMKRPEHSVKVSAALKGKPKSEKHKQAIAENWHNTRELVCCSNCGMKTTKGMNKRWHEDNCRHSIGAFA